MFGSQMIEVLIGLGFLFFLLSVIVSTVRETIEGFLQTRAIHLERGMRELLRDPNGTQWTKALYAHPQISALFRGDYDPGKQLVSSWMGPLARKSVVKTVMVAADTGAYKGVTPYMAPPAPGAPAMTEWKRLELRSNLPAYIPSRNFAAAMLDLTGRGALSGQVTDATAPLSFAQIRAGIALLPNPTLQRAMLLALDDAKGDIDKARANLEAWYDSTMDRVSGWYRKETQTILFVIGLLLAVALNVDTIRVANALSQNQTLRAVIVAKAQEAVAVSRPPADKVVAGQPAPTNPAAATGGVGIDEAATDINTLGYPIGWVGSKSVFKQIALSTIPGWFITAFALTLGAPFWFDLLNKLMVVRSTVKPHQKSGEEASADLTGNAAAVAPAPATAVAINPAVANIALAPGVAAVSDPADAFVPHEWADGRPPQEGLL